MSVEYGGTGVVDLDSLFETLVSGSSSEVADKLSNFVENCTPQRQTRLLEDEIFLSIAGSVIDNSDSMGSKVSIASKIVSGFTEGTRLEAYDTLSKLFGLKVSPK